MDQVCLTAVSPGPATPAASSSRRGLDTTAQTNLTSDPRFPAQFTMPPKEKAKVKFPCGYCSTTTTSTFSLECRICKWWHHKDCCKDMTPDFFKMLEDYKKKSGQLLWLCDKCSVTSKKLEDQINILSQRVDKVEEMAEQANKTAERGICESTKANSRIDALEKQTATSSTCLKTSVVAELTAIDDRKKNLVVSNLPESPSNLKDDRLAHDNDQLIALLTAIRLNPDDLLPGIKTFRRLGHLTDIITCRPLLIVFTCREAREEVMANARFLAQSDLKDVSLRPDLTKEQQTVDKALRKQAYDLNQLNPIDDSNKPFLWKLRGEPGLPNRRLVKIYNQVPSLSRPPPPLSFSQALTPPTSPQPSNLQVSSPANNLQHSNQLPQANQPLQFPQVPNPASPIRLRSSSKPPTPVLQPQSLPIPTHNQFEPLASSQA